MRGVKARCSSVELWPYGPGCGNRTHVAGVAILRLTTGLTPDRFYPITRCSRDRLWPVQLSGSFITSVRRREVNMAMGSTMAMLEVAEGQGVEP